MSGGKGGVAEGRHAKVELKSTLERCVKLITYAKSEHFLETPLWD